MSLVEYTSEIVTSYLSRNRMAAQDVTDLIEVVHHTLVSLSSGASVDREPGAFEDLLETGPLLGVSERAGSRVAVPCVPVDQAVTRESVFCLICGKASKAIKGHLTKTHHMDIPTYRATYGLPKDFPMVAPAYSETRRQLALDAKSGERLQAGRAKKKGAVSGTLSS